MEKAVIVIEAHTKDDLRLFADKVIELKDSLEEKGLDVLQELNYFEERI